MLTTAALAVVAFASVCDGYSMAAARMGTQRVGVAPHFPAAAPVARHAAVFAPRAVAPVMEEAEDIIMKETATRSLVKAVGWRFTAGVVTAITSMIFTGSFAAMLAIVGWDLCSKSVTMFLGERIWNKFDWGKEKGADSSKRSLAKASPPGARTLRRERVEQRIGGLLRVGEFGPGRGRLIR